MQRIATRDTIRPVPVGFTLIEVLVVITMLAVITAIGVANVSGLSNEARRETARYNARVILSIYAAAIQAGADESADGFLGLATKKEILEALEDGVAGSGSHSGTRFRVAELDPRAQIEAEAFLSYDPATQTLAYNPNGALP